VRHSRQTSDIHSAVIAGARKRSLARNGNSLEF
jgi:hypothetical protein